jgi:HTH-type transcriptional regulator/antitoxin HigA
VNGNSPDSYQDDDQAALREVSAFLDQEPEPGSPEGDRFEIILTLLEAYTNSR